MLGIVDVSYIIFRISSSFRDDEEEDDVSLPTDLKRMNSKNEKREKRYNFSQLKGYREEIEREGIKRKLQQLLESVLIQQRHPS